MRLEDFGYDPDTGYHDKRLTRAESIFVGLLWGDHEGKDNKIPAIGLAVKFALEFEGHIIFPEEKPMKELEHWKRQIRYMQTHILEKHDNIPVFSKAGIEGGYWIAEDEEESEEYYYTMRKRGLRGLVKATRGKRAAAVEAVEQLAFEFDDLMDKTTEIARDIPRPGSQMAPEIVDMLLAKMTGDPEKFASNLRKIREKYFSGGVLLERKRLEEMQAKVSDVLTGLKGLMG